MLTLRYRRKQWPEEGSKGKRLDIRFSKKQTGRNSNAAGQKAVGWGG